MAYEKQNGDIAVFKNDKKEKDTHPDYRISGLTLDGRPMKGALWLKKDRNGNTFMAGKIEVDEYAENKSRGGGGGVDNVHSDGVSGRGSRQADYDSDIPFLSF